MNAYRLQVKTINSIRRFHIRTQHTYTYDTINKECGVGYVTCVTNCVRLLYRHDAIRYNTRKAKRIGLSIVLAMGIHIFFD